MPSVPRCNLLKGVLKGDLNGGKVKFDGKLIEANAEAKNGKFSLDNSTNAGVSLKVGPASVEGNINVGHLVKGSAYLIKAGIDLASEKISGWFRF